MTYEPNMSVLEIAITYVCNVSCNNCLALSPQAPTKRDQDMTLEDIERFLAESVACNYPWTWLKLHGGEPTLHRQLMEICHALTAYKTASNPAVRLSLVSNDTNRKRVEEVLAAGFDPQLSYKAVGSSAISYVPVNVSPKDIGVSADSGCFIPRDCGISLNNLGFWPCSPSAAAARVFDYEAPVKHVQDLTPERLKVLYSHCDHCGFAIRQERTTQQMSSPTWATKLAAYNLKGKNTAEAQNQSVKT